MFDRSHTKPFQYFRDNSPLWMTDEAIKILMRGYLLQDETPNQMYFRLALAAASYYPNGIKGVTREELLTIFHRAFLWGWLSPATPVASNLGAHDTGLPCSCNSIFTPNSIDGIFKTIGEAASLTKHGAGVGVNLTELVGISSVVDWARFFDEVAERVSQGRSRRGAIALYLDIEHRDIEKFLTAKELLEGDPREKLGCNIAVVIKPSFMARLYAGEEEAKKIMHKVISLRMKYGSPYIQFMDNCREKDPECYKANGLYSGASNLCSEIFLHHDEDHTYSCILSSLNLAKYDEWKDYTFKKGITLPELGLYFLDAVCEEYIHRGSSKEGLQNSMRSAIKGRAVGLGTLGLHSLYMKRMLPWGSPEAYALNIEVHKFLQEETLKATQILALELGEPEWCKGFGIRNTHRIAIAPTTTNSVLCNGGSPGIEPIIANYFSMAGAKGTYTRQNEYLKALLQKKGKDNGYVWKSIREHGGSVQHLAFLSNYEKAVFLTAFEIDQIHIIQQAADRQKFICQGQSLNLFFKSDEDAQYIFDLHMLAHKLGLKALYYVRSDSQMVEDKGTELDYVFLRTRDDCKYCQKAKDLLDSCNIFYRTEYKATGRVPEVWIDGDVLDDGYNSLVKMLEVEYNLPKQFQSDCAGCEG